MEKILTHLQGDPLLVLLLLPRILSKHKIIQKISYFFYGFSIITALGDFLLVAFTNQWSLFRTQYAIFASLFIISCTSCATLYHSYYSQMFWGIYDMFPSLWPLHSLGSKKFARFEKIANVAKMLAVVTIIDVLAIITSNLPWYGDEYDLFFPIKVSVDYFNTWMQTLFSIIFYAAFYHFGLTVAANVFCLTYVVLHLENQFYLLNSRLKTLTKYARNSTVENVEYQYFVTEELVSCIKLHQTLLKYSEKLNQLIYFPIFYYTVSGIISALFVFLLGAIAKVNFFRIVLPAIMVVTTAVALCLLGQVVESESEATIYHAYNTPWYLWNTKNRKLLQMILMKSQTKVVLSSSGVITINFRLLISLCRKFYSIITFMVNVSNITK